MDRWEYGYLYFVQTAGKPDKGVTPPGPTVTVVADGSGHRCEPLKGRRLEVLNQLGADGWMISDGYWTGDRVRWLAEVVKEVDGAERMLGYWQFFMRRRLMDPPPEGAGKSEEGGQPDNAGQSEGAGKSEG